MKMMWGYDDRGFNEGGHPWLMVGMGVFWIVLAILAVWLIVRIVDRPRVHPSSFEAPQANAVAQSSPREILERRYASGEITAEQFTEAKKLLKFDK